MSSMEIKKSLDVHGEGEEPANAQPPPPKGGIPKQWLPGVIRWPLRVIILPFVWLDLASQWIARKIIRPPYHQEGRCLRRGNCCHYIFLPEPKRLFQRLFFVWFTQVNGFFLRRPKPVAQGGKEMMLMGCRYLKKDGSCAHYKLRPTICRTWPRIKHFCHPMILKGCGFRAVSKKTKR